jgi:hypothetical protein
MLNITQIPADRVAFIDEKTGRISREWYRFLLNLFELTGGGSNPVSITDLMVGPTIATAESQIAEIQKAIQGLALTPLAPSISDTLTVVLKRLQDLEVGPSLSGLVSDIANLQQQIQNAAGTPSDSSLRSDIANLQQQIQSLSVGPPSLPSSGGADPNAVTITGTQTVTGDKNFTNAANQFTGTAYYTSNGSASNGYFFENTSFACVGGVNGIAVMDGAYPGTVIFSGDTNTWRPGADNVRALGTASFRYTVVYATTGTINTSDATQKQQVRELTEAERRVAKTIKGLIRAFKWNDAVESKGDGARIHIGVMAQEVAAAFAAEGLDATKYGLFCQDTWTTLDGSQTRFGVRYEELLAFVIAAL